MALAERAQALALTKFATMVREDETRKKEENAAKVTHSDDLMDGPKAHGKMAHKPKTADLLPPIIWGAN